VQLIAAATLALSLLAPAAAHAQQKQPTQQQQLEARVRDTILNAQLAPQTLGAGWLSVVELHGVNLNELAAGAQGKSAGSGQQGNDTGLFNGDISSYLNTLLGAGKSVHGAFGSGKLYTTIGDVTLVAGAVGLGLGATLIIVGSHSNEQAGVSLAPGAAGANVGGASLLGRF